MRFLIPREATPRSFVWFFVSSIGDAAAAPPTIIGASQTNDNNSDSSSGANAHFACLAFVSPLGVHETREVDSGTAHKLDFADRAATHALRASSDDVSVIGTPLLEQLVTTADQCESLRRFLASVPDGGGPSLEFNPELRDVRFRLHVFGVVMVPKRVLAVWLVSISKSSFVHTMRYRRRRLPAGRP